MAISKAHKTKEFVYAFSHAPILYPITIMYLASVAAMVLVSAGWIGTLNGIVGLGFVAIMIVLAVMGYTLNEAAEKLAHVKYLIDGQHTEMLDRVDQLMQRLQQAGELIPADPHAPHSEAEMQADKEGKA
jgi:hypothetical protein